MFASIFVLQFKNVFILLVLAYLWYLVLIQNKRSNMQLKLIESMYNIEKEKINILY